MCTLREMMERFQMVRENIAPMTAECMLEEKEPIIALLIDQQENEHVDSQGEPLRQYSPQYEYEKKKMGRSGKTDFELTGDFHNEMNLRIDGEEFEMNSPALTTNGELKSEWLERWNGSPIMNLTPDNKPEAWKIVHDPLVNKIAAATGTEVTTG